MLTNVLCAVFAKSPDARAYTYNVVCSVYLDPIVILARFRQPVHGHVLHKAFAAVEKNKRPLSSRAISCISGENDKSGYV